MALRGRTQEDLFERSQNYPGSRTIQSQFETLAEQETWAAPENGARLWKSVVSGLIAGAAATWVMTQYQVNSQKLLPKVQNKHPQETGQSAEQSGGESTTVKIAHKISQAIRRRPVSEQHKELAGNLVHYGFGTLDGAIFGAICELLPGGTPLRGFMFGAAVWGLADEVLVPASGLAKWWPEYPTSVHLKALTAHLVYGATLDAAHLGVLRLLRQGEQIGRNALKSAAAASQSEAEQFEFRTPRVRPRLPRTAISGTRRYSRFDAGEGMERERVEGREVQRKPKRKRAA